MASRQRKIWIRVGFYLAVIALLFLWKKNRSRPNANAPVPTTNDPSQGGSAGAERPMPIAAAYPQVTFYWWTRRDEADGSQTVRVLVNFLGNLEALDWKDLKLRGPKGRERDLAEAEKPPDRPKPARGRTLITFHLPPGQPLFKAGRVYCWIKDLGALPAGQRLSPERFEQARKELRSGASGAAAPSAPGPDSGGGK